MEPPRMLQAWKAVSFTIRWCSNACSGNWAGWREGSLEESTNRKPRLSSIFAYHFYADKLQSFYSKCVNSIEFFKDACLNPGQKGQEERGENRRGRSRKACPPWLASAVNSIYLCVLFKHAAMRISSMWLVQTLFSGLCEVGATLLIALRLGPWLACGSLAP